MPREEHILRQVAWKEALEPYGKVELERSLDGYIIDVFFRLNKSKSKIIIEVGKVDSEAKLDAITRFTKSNKYWTFVYDKYIDEYKSTFVPDKIQKFLHRIKEYRLKYLMEKKHLTKAEVEEKQNLEQLKIKRQMRRLELKRQKEFERQLEVEKQERFERKCLKILFLSLCLISIPCILYSILSII